MNLSQFATPLKAKHQFIKAAFGGFAGSGKTFTATQFIIGCYKDMKIKKPLLLLDNEKGSRFLVPMFEKAGIAALVKDTVKLADLQEAMRYLEAGEIGFLFVDTLTKFWYDYVADYKQKNRKTFMTLQDWGKILPAWQSEFSDMFVNTNGNFVFTGRGGYTYDKEEDTTNENGTTTAKGQFVKSGVKMKLAGETPFEPDLNIWMDIAQTMKKGKPVQVRTAQIMKDRSNLIDGKTFTNPTYKDFQPVIQYLLHVEVGEVAGASNTDNIAPSENYDYYDRKKNVEVELEKIQAIFDKAAFGTSKDDKQVKTLIIEKIFGTTSSTEIEGFIPSRLTRCRIQLDDLMTDLANAVTDNDIMMQENKETKPLNRVKWVNAYKLTDPDEISMKKLDLQLQ